MQSFAALMYTSPTIPTGSRNQPWASVRPDHRRDRVAGLSVSYTHTSASLIHALCRSLCTRVRCMPAGMVVVVVGAVVVVVVATDVVVEVVVVVGLRWAAMSSRRYRASARPHGFVPMFLGW